MVRFRKTRALGTKKLFLLKKLVIEAENLVIRYKRGHHDIQDKNTQQSHIQERDIQQNDIQLNFAQQNDT